MISRWNFNPRAPRGARLHAVNPRSASLGFQSTRPARGATNAAIDKVKEAIFQSTRPARGATPNHGVDFPNLRISIHAPREGRDGPRASGSCRPSHFNPRAPRGARQEGKQAYGSNEQFQSTRPARGATWSPPSWIRCTCNFNPRAPRGARPDSDTGG